MVEAANSGHPGAPMGLAPLMWTLTERHLAVDPANPTWLNRDRLVLSVGHASALLYATLFMAGFDLDIEDLRQFRQLDSVTPGHPEYGHTPGVDTTTGPLGQGIANGVGFALAEAMLAARYNTDDHAIIDHHTWVICGDGDLQEGIALESLSVAARMGLGKLILIWDDNDVQLDGPTAWAMGQEDVMARVQATGWRTLTIENGEDVNEIDQALTQACQDDGRPTFIRVRTTIGSGSPNKAGTSKVHGAPLGAQEVALAKTAWGWEHEPFEIPEALLDIADRHEVGQARYEAWASLYAAWEADQPDLATQLERILRHELPEEVDDLVLDWQNGDKVATRSASHAVLNKLATIAPELIGGSADLASSNKTTIEGSGLVGPNAYAARNIQYGVREHAMAGIANGLALHGGLRPFVATFLVFSDYARGAIRIAALSGIPVIYVFTHDSFHVGEDGPTHQPVETIAALRAIPNLDVIRPADARETLGAWLYALGRTDGPTALILSRQDLPVLEGSSADLVNVGGYELTDVEDPDVILLATGSEVSLAVEAATFLKDDDGIETRIISVPERERFTDSEDADELLGDGDIPVVSVEAGVRMGWEGLADDHISMETFGASGPAALVAEHFGFTGELVANTVHDLIEEWDDIDEDDE